MFAILSFLAFTLVVAIVSYLKTKNDDQKDANVYFLAGRQLPWYVVTGSLMLTNLSTEQLVGLNGGAFRHGFEVMAWEVIAAIALVVMAVFFLPRYWSGKIATIPQFLENRFDATVRQIVSFVFLLTLCVGFLPFVLYSGAIGLEGLFDVSTIMGVDQGTALIIMIWGIGLVGGAYAIFGGLEAVAISDTINGIGLLIGGFLIPVLGIIALGDGSFGGGIDRLVENQAEQFHPIQHGDTEIPFGTLFTGMLLINFYYWCTNQAIVQRTFGARSLVDSQKGILGAAVLKLLGPIYLVLPGVIAFEMFGGDLTDGDLAYPRLVDAVLPNALVGFFGAVMFGAILSSFNSALHSCATLFGLDIFKGIIKKDATDNQTVSAGKTFGIILAILAMIAAPFIAQADGGLFSFMKKIAAIFNIPLLAIIIGGILLPKIPAIAAKIAVPLGASAYIFFSLVSDNHIFGYKVHWLHLAGINFLFLIIFMWVFSLIKPREVVAYAGSEKPAENSWRFVAPVSFLVIGLTIAMYAFLQSV
ncbi:MAG: solute:sodium symporter family transporter [Verrucomicrobiota bacterium]